MATANQEKTYNDLVKFYDLADNLIDKAEQCDEEYSLDQFKEIEQMVYFLEEATDVLTNDYIEIVKNSNNLEKVDEMKVILTKIKQKTKECKEKIKLLEKFNGEQ